VITLIGLLAFGLGAVGLCTRWLGEPVVGRDAPVTWPPWGPEGSQGPDSSTAQAIESSERGSGP
jgi:hypothetical protein